MLIVLALAKIGVSAALAARAPTQAATHVLACMLGVALVLCALVGLRGISRLMRDLKNDLDGVETVAQE